MGGAVSVPKGPDVANRGEGILEQIHRANQAKALINAVVNNLDVSRASALFLSKSNQNIALTMLVEDDLSRQAALNFLRMEGDSDVYLYFFEAVEKLNEADIASFATLSATLYTDFFIGFQCPLFELPAEMIQTITESLMQDYSNRDVLMPLLLDAQCKALEVILKVVTKFKHKEALRSKVFVETSVLVVDSNPALLSKYASDLLGRGFMVDVARTGQEAVARILAKEYSGVLIDYKLSDLSAIQVSSRIRAGEQAWCKTMRIVGMTAAKLKGMEGECLSAGMNALDMKPPEMNKFVSSLQKIELMALFDARKSDKVNSKNSKTPSSKSTKINPKNTEPKFSGVI